MKKLLFLLLFTLPVFCKAQTDSASHKQTVSYCTAEIYPDGSKYEIIMDDGTKKKSSQMEIKTPNGKVMKLDSRIAALNYVTQQGWTLVSSYAVVGISDAIGLILERPYSSAK